MSSEISKIERARLRNDFYIKSFRRIIWALIASFVVNIVLVSYIFVMRTHKTLPVVVNAITDNGQMIPLHPELMS